MPDCRKGTSIMMVQTIAILILLNLVKIPIVANLNTLTLAWHLKVALMLETHYGFLFRKPSLTRCEFLRRCTLSHPTTYVSWQMNLSDTLNHTSANDLNSITIEQLTLIKRLGKMWPARSSGPLK